MNIQSTIDEQEVAQFAQHAHHWWDKDGPLKTLHDLNPVRLAFIQQYVDLKNQRVLDLGCGGGILSEALALNGAYVTGLDVEEGAVHAAIAHAETQTLSIQYVCEPVEHFISDAFASIVCMEMLEHVAQPHVIIEHAARLLAPGGYLFLSTINRTLKAYLSVVIGAEYVLGLLPRQTHDYKKFIKPSELAQMVRAADLSVVGMKGLSYHPCTREAALQDAVDVNYLMVCQKLHDS